jgi:hypothetical protein
MLSGRTRGRPDCSPDGAAGVLGDCSVVEEVLEEALALFLLTPVLVVVWALVVSVIVIVGALLVTAVVVIARCDGRRRAAGRGGLAGPLGFGSDEMVQLSAVQENPAAFSALIDDDPARSYWRIWLWHFGHVMGITLCQRVACVFEFLIKRYSGSARER